MIGTSYMYIFEATWLSLHRLHFPFLRCREFHFPSLPSFNFIIIQSIRFVHLSHLDASLLSFGPIGTNLSAPSLGNSLTRNISNVYYIPRSVVCPSLQSRIQPNFHLSDPSSLRPAMHDPTTSSNYLRSASGSGHESRHLSVVFL